MQTVTKAQLTLQQPVMGGHKTENVTALQTYFRKTSFSRRPTVD